MAKRFNFVGKIKTVGTEEKPTFRNGTTKSGANYKSYNGSISSAVNNSAFIEVFGMEQSTINTSDTEGNKIEIAWKNRLDPDVIKNVVNYRKRIYDNGNARNEYISDYDFVNTLEADAEELNGKLVCVTGQINPNIYNGKISDRFVVQNLYIADEDRKSDLRVTMTFFWNKECIDLADYATEKKIYINGYTLEYIDKDTGNKYIPQQIVLDVSKFDLENEKHVARVKALMFALGISYNDNKPKVSLKGSNYYSQSIDCKYVNGSEEKEITFDDLTDFQKMMVESGLKNLDDFKERGVYGARQTIYKVCNFNGTGDYADGMVDTEMKASEFEEEIYYPAAPESSEVIEKAIENETIETDDDDELEDLFG